MKLPEKPENWRKQMTMHLNFGKDRGRGEYKIMDDTGKVMPFIWFYDTRKEVNKSGFVHPDCSDVMTWQELRAFMEGRDE